VALGRGLSVLINPADVAAVADGVVVNAVWAVGQMVARPRESRRTAADLDTAQWADSERLIRDALADVAAVLEIPGLSEQDAAELTAALRRHEVQGALQALLAVRLTDAPEVEAARARKAIQLALSGWVPPPPGTTDRRAPPGQGQSLRGVPLPGAETAGTRYAHRLSEYFDGRICGLVATLEGRVGFARLAQVRAEAYNARIVALLGAIERQLTALADPGRGGQDEAEFLARYRRQAHQRHGFLTPPDFDRRRRVPVGDIYVPTGIKEEDYPERAGLTSESEPGSVTVWDLVGLLDRTVLLGAPGGGKTTAANVLTDRYANDPASRIPFLVTLREYAAKAPIDWSVAECIEQNLKTVYQCHAPEGLVERLLLTGQAVVVFDGLDELLDPSRRRDVSDRVEQFCSAYPLTPVLVTSRVVGYDQARLDDRQFTCYRLGGFGDDDVAEYARKWFATQDGMPQAEAAAQTGAFLAESANAADLRANPLLLSLMCILYRGAGSLPGDRAGIYARCAELLLRKWDEQRDLYRKLDADHLVEPTLRYLAWWLFTREDGQTATTERELIAKTAEYLYLRGYETEDEARAAAREFIEFCRGRMWVFSDAGTTAEGEGLYGFTHRTFLEYFTAWHLAVTADSPEDLARTLAPRIASPAWSVVSELAVKIKSGLNDRGADRIYTALLDAALASADCSPALRFLAVCLPSARPSPSTVRTLTRAVLDDAPDRGDPEPSDWGSLNSLLNNGGNYKELIADEMTSRVATLVSSDDTLVRLGVLRMAIVAPFLTFHYQPLWGSDPFWDAWLKEQASTHAAEISWAVRTDHELRTLASYAGIIAPAEILRLPDGLVSLATGIAEIPEMPSRGSLWGPYILEVLKVSSSESATLNKSAAAAIGRYLANHGTLPWLKGSPPTGLLSMGAILGEDYYYQLVDQIQLTAVDEMERLGIIASACISYELIGSWSSFAAPTADSPVLFRYIANRRNSTDYELEDLPVPDEFKKVFRDWAAGRIDFVDLGTE
jgi:hypothetical protein